ncbi:MAG: DNA polymerase III subunit gamma/tau [Candidatus Edwardsbacteria bacterium]|jgi:DNA polymerase-3 subunit gamma/tau|nr:DNA polymerase III subunit gamma/tau [Candidatus Edwardsbacteria bacterium]
MSYLVLARKWRPQRFEDIVGQDHVTTTLSNAIKTGRVAHAYLFTGSRGVGKTTTARILAKALNCERGPTVTPCNTCPSCLEITASNSMDVMEIDGASNRGIEDVRELRENVKYTPTRGRRKVYIIDEVHMLTKEAFNALLKTLEEPPAHVVFIFATTEVHKLPMTILSRCQRFDFRRIDPAALVAHLKTMLAGEAIAADDECLYVLAQKSEGSARDAISLLDQLIAYGGERLTAADARQVLGLVDETIYFRAMELVRAHDQPGMLDLVAEVAASGYDLQEFTVGWLDHLRLLLLIAGGAADAGLSGMPAELRDRYLAQGKAWDGRDLSRIIRVLIDCESAMRRSSQARLLLEVTGVRLCAMDATVAIEDVLKSLGGGGGAEPPARQPAAPPAQAGQGQAADVREAAATYTAPPADAGFDTLWRALLSAVNQRNMRLFSSLSLSKPVGIADGKLVLEIPNKFVGDLIEHREYLALLEEETARLWGQRIKICCRLCPPVEAAKPGAGGGRLTRQDEVERVKAEAMKNDEVRHLIDTMDGEII